jgi:hypothetical protein
MFFRLNTVDFVFVFDKDKKSSKIKTKEMFSRLKTVE